MFTVVNSSDCLCLKNHIESLKDTQSPPDSSESTAEHSSDSLVSQLLTELNVRGSIGAERVLNDSERAQISAQIETYKAKVIFPDSDAQLLAIRRKLRELADLPVAPGHRRYEPGSRIHNVDDTTHAALQECANAFANDSSGSESALKSAFLCILK